MLATTQNDKNLVREVMAVFDVARKRLSFYSCVRRNSADLDAGDLCVGGMKIGCSNSVDSSPKDHDRFVFSPCTQRYLSYTDLDVVATISPLCKDLESMESRG